MPRPFRKRFVRFWPSATIFKPVGIPIRMLEHIQLEADELEAIRLKDVESLGQEEVAKKMRISRPTVVRILQSARRKISNALVNGKAIEIISGQNTNFTPKLRRRLGIKRGFGRHPHNV